MNIHVWQNRRTGAGMFLLMAVALWASPCQAYINPGIGIDFLGTLFSFAIGIVVALAMILSWPIRWLIWRIRKRHLSDK